LFIGGTSQALMGKKPYVLFFVGNGVLLGKDGQLSQHDTPRKCGISHQ